MIRLITLNDDKSITINARRIHVPMTAKERAIQRFLIALLTTPGTRVDASSFGGGLNELFLQKRRNNPNETRSYVAKKLAAAESSLIPYEPDEPFAITGVILNDVIRKKRGLAISIQLEFQEALSENIILEESNVTV